MALRAIPPTAATPGRQLRQPVLVKAAERAVRVIEALAAAPSGLTLAELQERVGFPQRSLNAVVHTLCELRWIEADESGTRFGIGPHALLAGIAYLDKDPTLPFAHEVIAELRGEVGHTVHFARRDGAHVLYLASSESREPGGVVSLVGRRLPADLTALGRALLAELSRDQINDLLEAGQGATSLHQELARVRMRSWAFERELSVPGVACVASVVGCRTPATHALGCSMPAQLATDDELTGVVEAVVRHARRLAATLRRHGIR